MSQGFIIGAISNIYLSGKLGFGKVGMGYTYPHDALFISCKAHASRYRPSIT